MEARNELNKTLNEFREDCDTLSYKVNRLRIAMSQMQDEITMTQNQYEEIIAETIDGLVGFKATKEVSVSIDSLKLNEEPNDVVTISIVLSGAGVKDINDSMLKKAIQFMLNLENICFNIEYNESKGLQ